MCQDVVAENESRRAFLGTNLLRCFSPKEPDQRGNTFRNGGFCNSGCWLYPEAADSAVDEVLQQIAVIARQFDDEILLA
ncbi:hypothetical protein D3C83_90790 [compost metagenome]